MDACIPSSSNFSLSESNYMRLRARKEPTNSHRTHVDMATSNVHSNGSSWIKPALTRHAAHVCSFAPHSAH
eukprot:6198118-Pleurochrysis_carterae.AAC.2